MLGIEKGDVYALPPLSSLSRVTVVPVLFLASASWGMVVELRG